MTVPNKELLSLVFGRTIGEVHINGNQVALYPEAGIARSLINKYELMYSMKEWAFNLGYMIETRVYSEYDKPDWHIVLHKDNKEILFDLTHTENDAVTSACEWIRKNL